MNTRRTRGGWVARIWWVHPEAVIFGRGETRGAAVREALRKLKDEIVRKS